VALAALALALLGIVGLASPASAWHTTHAGLGVSGAALRILATIGGVVLVVAFLLLWVETPKAPRRKRKRRTATGEELDGFGASSWTAGKTAAVLFLAVALFCLAAWPLLSPYSAPPSPSAIAILPHASTAPAGVTRRRHQVQPGWVALPIVLTFAVLAPAAFLVRRRLNRAATPGEDPDVLGSEVRASIAALESEGDPRRAILRAYARMERAFHHVEIVRARDETASEFLVRAMRQLRVSADSAATLTGRFEEARFSTHVVTEGDRELALGSLRRVEQELASRP
jgi:hypothetical protein